MIVTTTDELAGHRIVQCLGVVHGHANQYIGASVGLSAGLSHLGGGEVEKAVELCESTRQTALERMVKAAGEMGATAIVAMRYGTMDLLQGGTAHVFVYGTAVKTQAQPPPLPG